MRRIVRAEERGDSAQPGIRSRHGFAAGANYDPDNTSFGALIGVDEHRLEPGAGFTAHGHRGVDIISWVLSGVLRHQDDRGRVELVPPGAVLVQVTGSGIRHSEGNASAAEPLHFVQTTFLSSAATPEHRVAVPPVLVDAGRFAVVTQPALLTGARTHLHVARGRCVLAGGATLAAGDSVRTDEPVEIVSADEVLVWTAPARAAPEGG